VGGDDPDAIAAEDDFLGDGEVGDRRSGRLMAPDEGAHEDPSRTWWPTTSASTVAAHPPRRLPSISLKASRVGTETELLHTSSPTP